MASAAEQVKTVRKAAGLFDEFPLRLLAVRGNDRVKFLHNVTTHDIKGLSLGQGRPACLLDRQGKIRASFIVHAQPEELILEMDPDHFDAARKGLEQLLISEAVEFEEVTDQHRILQLHGPSAAEIIAKARPEQIQLLIRWDLFHLPGFSLWVEPGLEASVRKDLLTEGAPFRLQAVGREAFEILRIEAGVPWPGAEIDESVILNELGTEEFVSFTKGCFLGQEIVARIKYRAHPPRLLKGFLVEGRVPIPPRSLLLLGEKSVGTITSSCFSPTLNRVIGMGFLNFGVEETTFEIKTSAGSLQAALTDLPFVKDRSP